MQFQQVPDPASGYESEKASYEIKGNRYNLQFCMIHILSIGKGKYKGRALCVLLIALLYNIFFCADNTVQAGQETKKETLEAVVLYNLAYFVTWPEDADSSRHSFNIGVISSNDFKNCLQRAVENETRDEKPFKIKELGRTRRVHPKNYKIVFVSSGQMPQWLKIKEAFRRQPILTVSDSRDFTSNGGMVSLLRRKDKIAIEINYKNVKQSGLIISAKLLRLATIVEQ